MLKKVFVIMCVVFVFHNSSFPNVTNASSIAISKNQLAHKNVIELQQKSVLDEFVFYDLNGAISRADGRSIVAKLKAVNEQTSKLEGKDELNQLSSYNMLRKQIERHFVYNDKSTRVNDLLTRAEASLMLMESFQIQEDIKTEKSFLDVKPNHFAYDSIMTLAELNIITDSVDEQYKPDAPITVAELASMIVAAMNYSTAIATNELIYNYYAKNYIDTKNLYVSFEQEIINEINLYRQDAGKKPLQYDPKLTQLAIIKVNDMIENNYFEHQSPTFNMPWELAGLFGYDFVTFGENLARHYTNAKDVVDAWIASPTHNENLLKESYQNVGVGIRKDNQGNLYFCNLFSGK
jgi:uncharacterized protein YkwD